MQRKPRLLRITTASISLKLLLRGQFTFFQRQGYEVLTVSSWGNEVADLLAEGIPHHTVPMTRKITPVQDLICLWKLIRIMQKFKPDIVHTHTPKAGFLGMMAAWICGVPARLHTVAGLPWMESNGVKRKVLIMAERITYACAHSVYPNSRGLLEFLVKELNPSVEKFKVIGRGSSNGIDANYFKRSPDLLKEAREIRVRYQIPDDVLVFSFVGRVVKDKGIIELVEAFKQLSTSHPIRLMLVGPFEQELDPLPPEVIGFILNSELVIQAGFQHDVRAWILASDIFVFPSYREGFPNGVMQAACLEIPCIVSDINGCNEIINHGETGLIVPVKNTELLRNAMLQLLADKEKRSAYAKKARNFVVENFDQPYVWGEIWEEYKVKIARQGDLYFST
jgi:glycosyltransferase involved in cell wall biosynthesis